MTPKGSLNKNCEFHASFGKDIKRIGDHFDFDGVRYPVKKSGFRRKIFSKIQKALESKQKEYEERFLKEGLKIDPDSKENQKKREEMRSRLARLGAKSDSCNTRLYTGEMSFTCQICPKGGFGLQENWIITKKCNLNCFFCYQNKRPSYSEEYYKIMDSEIRNKKSLLSLSFTGGEPLLEFGRILNLIQVTKQKFGRSCNTYLYTNGSLLTEDMLAKLKDAGLDELRFNIAAIDYNTKPLWLAKKYIPRIVVETPAITEDKEKVISLLPELDRLGLYFMTLHELLYFGYNTEEYKKRGCMIKDADFNPFYFERAVPIAGSEEAVYEVMEYALKNRIKTTLHYCSCSFKQLFQHRSKVYYQLKKSNPPQRYLDPTGLTFSILVSREDQALLFDDIKRKRGRQSYHAHPRYIELHPDYLPYLNPQKYDVVLCYRHKRPIVDIGLLSV